MRVLKKIAGVLGLTALFGVTSAFAGAGIVTTTVTALALNVSYSTGGTKPLVTYIGYLVTIGSDASNTNTINNIVFTGTASATDIIEKPIFFSADGATCTTTNADQTAISCTIGQLRAGQTFPTFAVFFKAPVKNETVPPGVGDAEGTDFAMFSGTTFYAEGTGGPNSVPQNSTVIWSAADVLLGTPNPTNVKSSVPKGGGTFFTGVGAVATVDDPWTTSVTVPGTTTYTTAEVTESKVLVSCSPNPEYCLVSALDIPGTFQSLEITLRRDASTIAKGAKIDNVIVFYNADLQSLVLGDPIVPCEANGMIPANQQRCISSRTAYTKRTAPTPEFEGDWEIVIRAKSNGRNAW